MRAGGGRLRFAPCLPAGITRLGFRLRYRGSLVCVSATREATTYRLLDGPPITVLHCGERVELGEEQVTRPNPPREEPDRQVRQPPGREPRPR
ncbi:hypothetical protein GCM10020001_102600 [Nonomuraea salmonea]